MAIRASGGMALFIMVMIWWLSPLAPVERSDTPPETSDNRMLEQTLSGNIRDEAGNLLASVEVFLPAYGHVDHRAVQSARDGALSGICRAHGPQGRLSHP